MDILSVWIAPPLIGAVIGAFTNWLAIKMLFRPYAELRVFGLRMPFTPGLLPRERRRLSRSLGETVAIELITEDVIKRRLAEPDIRGALLGEIARRLEALSKKPAASLLFPLGTASGGRGNLLGEIAETAWNRLISSPAFRAALAGASRAALTGASSLPLASVLPPEKAGEFAAMLLAPEGMERLRTRLSEHLDETYRTAAGPSGRDVSRRNLAREILSAFPREAAAPLVDAMSEGLFSAALPVIESFLRRKETRATLERYSLEIVRRALGRLNPLQRLIVSAAQYERDLAAAMPQTVDDLVDAAMTILRAERTRKGAAEALSSAFARVMEEGPAASLRALVSRKSAIAALDSAFDALAAGGPAVAERVASYAASRSDASVGSVFDALGLAPEEIARKAADAIARALGGKGPERDIAASAAAAFGASLAEALGDASVEESLGLSTEARAKLSAELADRALALLSAEAGRIVAGLDIAKIVVERIDELDMGEVERLTLAVVGKELAWITFLGGLLGGIIGFAQSLILVIRGG